MDAVRRLKTPGSETKDFIIHIKANSVSMFVFVSFPPNPMEVAQKTQMDKLHMQWVTLKEGNLPFQSKVFVTLLFVRDEDITSYSVLLPSSTALRNGLDIEWLGSLIVAYTVRCLGV